MNHQSSPETATIDKPTSLDANRWLDDTCITDLDNLIKTLSGIKSKGVRPDLIGSIITHYACKWIPELSNNYPPSPALNSPPQSATASWLKKKFLIETIITVLPPEKDSISLSFLLKLLKNANMSGVDKNYRKELENKIAWRLDQATLKELMIPCFSHYDKGTLFDIELMLRLVKKYVEEFDIDHNGSSTSGVGMFKVAKLVDAYLAEAAVDSELGLSVFMDLARAVPDQARTTDDGLYRAIDTYLKTHMNVTKQERKTLCKLIDSQKLSIEASLHAAQNERLPVRSVIQVLFSEQAKLHSHIDWSRSFSTTKSPNIDTHDRCHSSRDVMTVQQIEIKKLKENVTKLERQCQMMQTQIDRLSEKKKGFFSWKKIAMSTSLRSMSVEVVDDGRGCDTGSIGRQTPLVKGKQGRTKTPKRWRQSTS